MRTTRLEPVVLLASAARTATGSGDAVRLLEGLFGGPCRGMALVLDVTEAATAAGDTLDVAVQTKLDGTNWLDVAAFTQVLGNGGAKRYVAKLSGEQAQAMFEVGSALAAGSVRHLLGLEWRVRWTIAEADAASFTFSVVAVPQ